MIIEEIKTDISKNIKILTNQNSTLVLITLAAVLGKTISVFLNSEDVLFYIKINGEIRKIKLELDYKLHFKDLLLVIREKLVNNNFEDYEADSERVSNQILLCDTGVDSKNTSYNNFLKLGFKEKDGKYLLIWELDYNNKYWSTIFESFKETFNYIMEQSIEDPNIQMDDYVLVDPSVQEQIFSYGRGKSNDVTLNLVNQIYKTVNKFPNKIAITAVNGTMSYGELWDYSSSLAIVLGKMGISNGDCVAICARRNLETIVGILAIIRVGAAYVPIEMDYGIQRIKYIIADSNSKCVLTSGDAILDITHLKTYNILLDRLKERKGNYINYQDESRKLVRYIIYTSGSTGNPKGVAIDNEQLLNLCDWYKDEIELTVNDKLLLLHPFGFDASIKNIFSSLSTGSELVLGPERLFDLESILELISNHDVTLMNCVPSLFYELLDIDKNERFKVLKKLRLVILGGEAIEKRRIKPWIESNELNLNIMNVYGPTECTSVSSYSILKKNELKSGADITIGSPTYNKQIYIMNMSGKLCPEYAKGELCISGIGTISSYIGKFKNNKDAFSKDILNANQILYHTGDIAYWNKRGELVFVGRKDRQVKIDGHRIELGEIEQTILKCYPQIEKCCVVVAEEQQHKEIIAHIVVERDDVVLLSYKNKLADWLPAYMIPKKIINHNVLPLTTNGKVDFKKLSHCNYNVEINKDLLRNNENEITEKVANIWMQLLETQEVDYDENFFDAGGYSLLLYKLSKMIEKELNCKITFVELMTYTTINSFSNYIIQKMNKNTKDCEKPVKLELKEIKNKRN